MKHQTPQLVKFKKLHRRLGFSKVRETIGLLETMWLFTQREAKRGDIGKFDNETIAIELEWDGEPDELVAALVSTGWLNENPQHRLVVHDWSEHAPRYIHGIVSKVGGFIEPPKRQSPTIEGDYSEPLQSSTDNDNEGDYSPPPAGAREPNLTQPNLTTTSTTSRDSKEENAKWVVVVEELSKVGVGAASSTATEARRRGFRPEVVLAYVAHYRDHVWAWDAGAVRHVLAEAPPNCPPRDAIWPRPREPDARAKKSLDELRAARAHIADKGLQLTEEQFRASFHAILAKLGMGDKCDEALCRERWTTNGNAKHDP